MPRFFTCIVLAAAFLLAASCLRADSLTFTLNPSTVSGPAGTTVGWGFSLTNSSAIDYLDLSGIDSDLFLAVDGTPDASIFPFPNLAPGQTMTQAYDPADGLGLFQFTWNAGLAAGTAETGQFRLLGAFCDPAVDQFCAEDDSVPSTVLAAADYTAIVSPASGGIPVPEPSSFLLLGTAVLAMAFRGCLRRRSPRMSLV
jgi:PEP-CTERM motif-containing protein